MADKKLLELLQAQARLLAGMSSAQLTLERIVLALIETHEDKAAVLARIEGLLEADTVKDLYAPQQPELEQAADEQRKRLIDAVRKSCSS